MNGIYVSPEGARTVEQRYREYLERWPVPSEHLRVPTRQGETFVVACGPKDAPPLMLLHGSMANTSMWMADVAAWSRDFRVYAVDMIGEPGLSAPSRPPLASDAYALWLDDVLQGLGVRRVSIVGVSLGGWLATDYATRNPERVDRLALLCPGGIGRQKTGWLLLALLLLSFGKWGRRKALGVILGPTAPATTPEAQAFGEYMMLINKHFRPRREKIPVFDDDALRRLTMPMLVIVGGLDTVLDSHDTRRRLEQAVPHATVNLLPDAGHLLEGQTMPILDFLRAPEGARPHV
ncbi:pimeloyl-ACP methyl ester carboxylesterase [Streptosporangium becharense]|uniref:Pimeloyl-ACP methyl ester carboxylesterase n=1 Tax=Streptosporangium becharense TaxID=1816182 RepID=A0A7W9IHW8_9ACTN|nr:alpha/beta hydrolase [Streptosporangium becharense]MBB2915512.1 pimeloyl-ACP methyl ester carboxylesterase [Streptosporangium becharense]MBB5821017.1 pimeloyl-ACP methyl ester carboxylesterase [Streptosporangium becharense]